MPPVIAFTSCMDATREPRQPVWDAIGRCNQGGPPDILLLLGDQIYMDWGIDSLAGVPTVLRRWQAALDASNPSLAQKVLERFASEMHGRYKAQWAVPEFRALVQRMQPTAQQPIRRHLLLAWDDHDFAWNNAMGQPGVGRGPSAVDNAAVNDHVVPFAFKQVSLMLRSQFAQVLRGNPQASYPDMPSLACALASDCAVPSQSVTVDGFTVTVLDQRWSRTDRDAVDAQLLSADDRTWLKQEIARADAGLLILAGSTPLKHKSVSGAHDSWWAPPDPAKSFHHGERSYPEYDELVQGARRPVLVLAGDIHRNAWGGHVELADEHGRRAPVLQACSSAAALGRAALVKRYFPCYGVVRLSGPKPQDTAVTVEFHQVLDHGDVTGYSPRFTVSGGQIQGWVDDGECTDTSLVTRAGERLCWQLAQRPLPVLAWRAAGEALHGQQGCTLAPQQLDELGLTDDLRGNGQAWPSLLRATALGPQVSLQRIGPGPDAQHLPAFWAGAVAQAVASQATTLVLFVHGFGKGSMAAMGQAAEMRKRFSGIEVALFTWPSSAGSGLSAALGFPAIQAAARAAAPALAASIIGLCQAARPAKLSIVLMVRSLGALVLAEAAPLLKGYPADQLKRVVLNAPACSATHLGWLEGLGQERVCLTNRHDKVLGLADWVHNGPLLGNDPLAADGASLSVLDCTAVAGVEDAHDYVLRAVNQALHELNQKLLTSATRLDTADFEKVPFLRARQLVKAAA